MKKTVKVIAFLLIMFLIVYFHDNIITYIMQNIVYRHDIVISEDEIYTKENKNFFLERTDDFIVKNSSQILDVFYTILDNGWSRFTFYCDYTYDGCIEEIKSDFDNSLLLSTLNSAVHPYNSYRNIELLVSANQGRIVLSVTKLYSPDKIVYLDEKIDEIYNNVTNSGMSTREKILAIHDYIVNNTSYDEDYVDTGGDANNAYGLFFNGKAVCSGYTDAMQLFLIKMGVPNYKLTSEKHIWNYLYLDGEWLNLDVLWDDPVTKNGKNKLIHDYFLISDSTLKSYNDGEHEYNNMFMIEKESQ